MRKYSFKKNLSKHPENSGNIENLAENLSMLKISHKTIRKNIKPSNDISKKLSNKIMGKTVKSSSNLVRLSEAGLFYSSLTQRGSLHFSNFCRVFSY